MSHQHLIPLELGPVPVIDLHADAVRLSIVPVEPGQSPRLEIDARGGRNGSPPIDVRKDGERTVIRVRTPGAPWHWMEPEWVKHLILVVPANVRAIVRSDMGRISVANLAGCDLQLMTHAGAVDLENVRGRLLVAVDSGAVKGEGLGGTFDVVSQAGSVKLGIDALDEGPHRIRTTMGSVKIELAPGLDVRIEESTTLGSTQNRYPTNASAKAVLHLSAELGSVKVREGKKADDPRHRDWPDWRRTWASHSSAPEWPSPSPAEPARPTTPAAASTLDLTPEPSTSARVGDDELRKVLELLQDGKVSASDAERLIRAMGR